MTDTTPAAAPARPGNDVVAAVVLAFALVIGGAVALALTGDDRATALRSGDAAKPGASDPSEEPVEAPTEPSEEPVEEPSGAPAPAPTAAGTCTYPKGEKAVRDVGVPPTQPLPVGGKRAVLETTAGRIVLTLSSSAPCTTSSFAYLASKGYFDDTPCHRMTTEGIFVLQCGDPSGQGSGGPGYLLPDEALEGAAYPTGTVAMANTGAPGSGGSQFFLVYQDTQLPPTYTPWAKVTEGLEVLQGVAAAGTEPAGDGAPKKDVTIRSVTVG